MVAPGLFAEEMAMLGEEYALAVKQSASLADNTAQIAQLEAQKVSLNAEIDECNRTIRYYNESLNTIAQSVIWEFDYDKEPLRLLYESLKAALKVNREFNHPFFKVGLISALNNPATIRVVPTSGSAITVMINLDETAGSIQEYANAIKAVRTRMRKMAQNHELSPQEELDELSQRDKFWEEKFYKPARQGGTVKRRKYNRKTKKYTTIDKTSEQIAKYWNTLKARQAAWGKPAPYWELIDKGQSVMDGAGKPYPIPKATNFVNKAKSKIMAEFNMRASQRKTRLDRDIDRLYTERSRCQHLIEEIDFTIEELKKQLTPEAVFLQKVERLGRAFSKEKVMQVFKALYARELGDLSITAEGRVELTAPGQKRFRISLVGIRKRFNFSLD